MSYLLLSFFIAVVVFPVFIQFGITNAGVIDGFEFLDKGSFDRLHIAEAEGGIAQETVGDLRVDDTVDELRDGGFNFDVCGYPHEEEEILPPDELIRNYKEERAKLDAEIDQKLARICEILGIEA
jgi:hypothetical protein